MTQNIFDVDEVNNISLENGKPKGHAKFLGQCIFESLSNKNILYFSAYESQIFHYAEETFIDNAVMRKIKKYKYLFKGPLTYERFFTSKCILISRCYKTLTVL